MATILGPLGAAASLEDSCLGRTLAGRVGREGGHEVLACRLSRLGAAYFGCGGAAHDGGACWRTLRTGCGRSGNIAQKLLDGQELLGVRHFQQAKFEVKTLFLLVSQFAVSAKHDLEMAGEVFFAEPIGDAGNAFAFFTGNLEQGGIFAGDFRDRGVAQEANHLTGEVSGTVAFADEVVNLTEDFFAAAFGNRLHHLFENVGGSGADQVADRVSGDASAGGGNGLIEDGERIAHGAVAGFGEQRESVIVGFDFFAGDQVAQLGDDVVELDGAKTEMLAARADGLRNVLRLRGGEHEDDVVGRLFQRLEQRVEGSVGDLVRFVEDVDFEAVASRTVAGGLAEFADFVDAAVRGGVDLDDVDGVAGSDFGAGLADAAGFGDRVDPWSGSSGPWPECERRSFCRCRGGR